MQTLGSHFIPRGFAPWDEIGSLGFAKIICLPIGDHAIVLLWSLLNEKSTQIYSYVINFAAFRLGFMKKILKIDRNCFAIAQISVKLKIKVICKTFVALRECKSFADHFDFHFDGKFRKMCICYRNCFSISYLVNYIAICYCVIAEREAMVFASLPWDKMAPKGLQNHSLPIGDHAKVLL